MNYRHNLITLNTDGNDFAEEFKLIKELIKLNNMKDSSDQAYSFHLSMEREFGERWRLVCFHIIDQSCFDPDERLELLKALTINCYRDCDEGVDLDDIKQPITIYHEQLLNEFRHYLNTDQIDMANKAATDGLALSDVPIAMIIELLFFFVRYDEGYKTIAKYSNTVIANLNEHDRKVLSGFLCKLIDVGYLEKMDLSVETTAIILSTKNVDQ